jgi:hypothetical protein
MRTKKLLAGVVIAGGLAAAAVTAGAGVAEAAPGPIPAWGGPPPGPGWGHHDDRRWDPPAPNWGEGPLGDAGWNNGWQPPGGICIGDLCI